MNPKISLIIPIYNVEKYLKRCLNSAINQSLIELEIILINDGSSDSSLIICNEYATEDSRIIIIDQDNNGLGISRNNGLAIAKGEFICFLDSDDWLDQNTLEVCYKKSIDDMSDIVIFGFDRIDENTGETIASRDDLNFNYKKISKNNFFKKVIGADLKHMACAMIVKRSLFMNNSLKFPAALHEDLYVTPQLFYFSKKVSVISENYYKWLIRKGSITNTISSHHIDGIIAALFSTKIFLIKENIYENYKVEFSQFYLTYLNLIFKRIFKFEKNINRQKKLFSELMFKSTSIVDIGNLEALPLHKQQKFANFFQVFQNVHKKINTSEQLKQHNLEQQLSKIKKSRGYKLLLIGYRFQNKVLPLHSNRRKALKILLGKEKNWKTFSLRTNKGNIKYDIVFMPHKDYHVWTMGLIAQQLLRNGISSCMMDLTDYYRDEGARDKAKDFPNIPFIDYSFLRDDKIEFDTIICMNDWDKKYVRPEIVKAKNNNKKTIGIVEGIQDFFDLDTKQDRKTYKTVEYVLLTGEHDHQFFEDCGNKTHIIGVPRLASLLEEDVIFPKNQLAVINMNFSYNSLNTNYSSNKRIKNIKA